MKTEYKMSCGFTATITTTPKPEGVHVKITADLYNSPYTWMEEVEGWMQTSRWHPSAEEVLPNGGAARAWVVERLRRLDMAIQAAIVSADARKYEADHCMDGLMI